MLHKIPNSFLTELHVLECHEDHLTTFGKYLLGFNLVYQLTAWLLFVCYSNIVVFLTQKRMHRVSCNLI